MQNVNCHGRKYPAVCAAENEAEPMGEHLRSVHVGFKVIQHKNAFVSNCFCCLYRGRSGRWRGPVVPCTTTCLQLEEFE